MNSTLNRLKLILLAIICMALFSCKDEKQPPNIIFIMSDDHASGAISAYGNSLLETPNIDKLADQGMRFNNCFNVVSLCGPSRAAILSGTYSIHNGYMRNGDSFERNQITFPKLLQQAGYETAIIGKWHLVTQPAGFDYYNVIPFQGKFFDCPMKETGQEWQDRDKKRPFCLLVHHKALHEPYHYPERYEELLEGKTIAEPDNFNDTFDGKNHVLANNECRYSKFNYISMPFLKDILPQDMEKGTADYKTGSYPIVMRGYHRLVAALDENIGRLMDFVDNSELEKNTIVVYTSDNGWFLGDHGLFNKMWMYEESLHVPLIIRYPGKVKPATVSDDFVSVLDFATTFLDYAGIKKPVQFQGQSIKPVLMGDTPNNWRSAHFYHYFGQFEVPSHYGIRTHDYKLIYFYEAEQGPKWELYDMKDDPEYTDIFQNLEILLQEKRKEFEESKIWNI